MKRILLIPVLLVLLAATASGQAIDALSETTRAVATDKMIVQTNSAGSAGQKFTRSITLSNLWLNLTNLFPIATSGGAATNAVSTVKTNGTTVSAAATSLDIITGSNTVVLATNTGGAVTVQINSTASGSGSSISTNGNQFGASSVLTIKSGAQLTNVASYGTLTAYGDADLRGTVTIPTATGAGGLLDVTPQANFASPVHIANTNFVSVLSLPGIATNLLLMTGGGSNVTAASVGTGLAFSDGTLAASGNLANWVNIPTGAMANATSAAFLTNQITTASNAVMSQLMTASNNVYSTETTRNAAVSNAAVAFSMTASNTLYSYTDTAASNRVRLTGGTGGITVSQSGSGGVQTWTINDDDAGGGATTNFNTLGVGSITVGTVIASNLVRVGRLDGLTNVNAGTLTATNWVQVNGPQTNSGAVYATSTMNVDGVVTLGADINVPSGTIAGSAVTVSSTLENNGRNVENIDKVGTSVSVATTAGPHYSIQTNTAPTFTFSGTPLHGQRLSIMVSNTSTAQFTVGFPTAFSVTLRSNVTGWPCAASNYVILPFIRTTNEIGGGIWLLDRVTDLEAALAVASAGANGFLALSTNAGGNIVTVSNAYIPQGSSMVLSNLAGVGQYFTNGQASSMVLSNVAASGLGFATVGVVSNLSSLKYAIQQPAITASNLVLSFSTNRFECVGLTNVILTNLVEEATAVGADMTVLVRATTGNTTLVWPSYGAQHGYFLRTNQNNYALGWAAVTNGKTAVISFTAFGTNIFTTITEWP